MAKQLFRTVAFKPESRERIDQCNAIIDEYQAQGLRLTLRQCFYQLVARGLMPNTERSYKNLSSLLTDARMAGLVDWDAIEDRTRPPYKPNQFRDLEQLVEAALVAYRLPRWADQPQYVELFVEKQALANVLTPIAREFHVTLMINRGYSSASSMYESAQRMLAQAGDGVERKALTVLYLGDHDPSGEDMVRDVRDRLETFGVDLQVHKIALTMEQIRKYNPPPNPAKTTDPRAAGYVAKHGDQSWELDALPPDVLAKVVRSHLGRFVNKKRMQAVIEQETRDKQRLRDAVASLRH